MQKQKKPEVVMWKLDIETTDKKPLPKAIMQILTKTFKQVITNLNTMGILRQVKGILIVRDENKKLSIQVVKDLPTIKKIGGSNGSSIKN